jgi:hypothetical protein
MLFCEILNFYYWIFSLYWTFPYPRASFTSWRNLFKYILTFTWPFTVRLLTIKGSNVKCWRQFLMKQNNYKPIKKSTQVHRWYNIELNLNCWFMITYMYIVNFITFKFNDLQYIPVYNFDIINVLLVLTCELICIT